ncbi:hypothetical protein EYF80_026714 [Liparis tanakae]|uniref:Uncharacterized protein n=1 Tax=Liparis tanakae TaxID=230148 RepID=A0A4Z2HB46_9TELE|nr:hypothetical protein EYF80_026714 [Liparis tanakae]
MDARGEVTCFRMNPKGFGDPLIFALKCHHEIYISGWSEIYREKRFLGFSSHPGPSQVPGSGGGGDGAAFAGAGVAAALLTLLSRPGRSYEMALSSFSSRQPPVQLQWEESCLKLDTGFTPKKSW